MAPGHTGSGQRVRELIRALAGVDIAPLKYEDACAHIVDALEELQQRRAGVGGRTITLAPGAEASIDGIDTRGCA